MAEGVAEANVFATDVRRAAALLLDLVFFAICGAVLLDAVGLPAQVIPIAALLYWGGLPLTPLGGTPGKWTWRIRLRRADGGALSAARSFLRAAAIIAWAVLPSVLMRGEVVDALGEAPAGAALFLLFAPWITVGLLPRRQSLFDLLAGSVVVRIQATEAAVAEAGRLNRPSIRGGLVSLALCLVYGVLVNIVVLAQADRDRRVRVAYAFEQIQPLRARIEEFRLRESRWPTAAEAGVADWTPYPAGGGYRYLSDGRIVVRFALTPGLKGGDIVWTPRPPAPGGRVEWTCAAEPPVEKRYLPSSCR